MRIVIVTGISGAGKSTALKMLEDAGYFCVDNLPVPLLPKFMEMLILQDQSTRSRAWNRHPEQSEVRTAPGDPGNSEKERRQV